MKLLIIGDSHGNIANLKHVMGFAKAIKAGAVIHTGDWYNFDNIEIVKDYGIPLYSCLGNADIDPRFKFEKHLKIEIDGIAIGIVHRLTKDYFLKIKECSVIFSGHYHSQKEWEVGGIKIIRPGALEKGINFAMFDTKTKMIEFVNDDQI